MQNYSDHALVKQNENANNNTTKQYTTARITKRRDEIDLTISNIEE